MQCQGKTRIGRRCRNRALDSELFCDIHMRVDHSQNLTLMLPLLMALASGYFFFFGLAFETAVFSVFHVNYLSYAGIEDLFLNMLKFGVTILSLVFILWLVFAIILALFYAIRLTYDLTKATLNKKIGVRDRFKIIGLGIAVFFTNLVLRTVSFIPALQYKQGDKVSTRRDNFSKSIFNIRNANGKLRPGRPILNARNYFSEYLYFRSLGHHRFLTLTAMIFFLSVIFTFISLEDARIAKACANEQQASENQQLSSEIPPNGYLLENDCSSTSTTLDETNSISLISRLYGYRTVRMEGAETSLQLLHLSTTSRFHIFYDGQNKRPVLIPNNTVTLPQTGASEFVVSEISQLQQQMDRLTGLVLQSVSSNNSILASLKQSNPTELIAILDDRTWRSDEILACEKTKPVLIVSFGFARSDLTMPKIKHKLTFLGELLKKNPASKILIRGFTDTKGNREFNGIVSQQRAEGIKQFLLSEKVREEQLIAVGMGESHASTKPARRAELRFCR
jgi:outer membrane protein OmpA-like peptidoglycan-associated protein